MNTFPSKIHLLNICNIENTTQVLRFRVLEANLVKLWDEGTGPFSQFAKSRPILG